MSPRLRQRILRANGVFLCVLALFGLTVMDIPAACCDTGVGAAALRDAPDAVIGLIEAHGLALILGALYLRAARSTPDRSWHLAAAATHLLLSAANTIFRGFFITGHAEWIGLIITPAHFAFAAAEAWAVTQSSAPSTSTHAGGRRPSREHTINSTTS